MATREKSRLLKIERTLRHAEATRRDELDSWLNAYQDDVRYLLTLVSASFPAPTRPTVGLTSPTAPARSPETGDA